MAQPKRQRNTPAIQFFQSIPSTWKGNERFALWIVQKLQPKITVDLGFDIGLSTISLAHRNKGHTYGIDWLSDDNFSAKKIAMDSAFQNILTAIRLKYVKNVHLIVGPINEISAKWNKGIDLLHIDCINRYDDLKKAYDHWKPFLAKDSVILIRNIASLPNEVGRFFRELPLAKTLFSEDLGLATGNESLCRQIEEDWKL